MVIQREYNVRLLIVSVSIWIIVLIALTILSGCATPQNVVPETRTALAQIPRVEKVVAQTIEFKKPEIKVVVSDSGEKVVQLPKKGLAELIELYSSATALKEQNAKLVTVTNKLVDERNDLLSLAQAEEAKGNDLRRQLAEAESQQQKDRIYNAIELNATRLLLVLSLLAGM